MTTHLLEEKDIVDAPRVVTLGDIVIFAKLHARAMGIATMMGALLGLASAVLAPREYTSSASFLPQTPQSGSNLSGLAAQLGVALPQSNGGDSPAFYVQLATSRAILSELVDTVFSVRDGDSTKRMQIADLYRVKPKGTKAQRKDASIGKLKGLLTVERDRETGVVSVTARTLWPELSQQIVRDLLADVGDFNVHTRQSRASAERAFTGTRLADARQALHSAEDAFASFQQGNRNVSGSAELGIARDRLTRAVSERQQIVTSLEQSYEQARIDEVRDTPVFTIIDAPEFPAIPDSRGSIQKIILGALLGWLTSLVLIVAFKAWSLISVDAPYDTDLAVSGGGPTA